MALMSFYDHYNNQPVIRPSCYSAEIEMDNKENQIHIMNSLTTFPVHPVLYTFTVVDETGKVDLVLFGEIHTYVDIGNIILLKLCEIMLHKGRYHLMLVRNYGTILRLGQFTKKIRFGPDLSEVMRFSKGSDKDNDKHNHEANDDLTKRVQKPYLPTIKEDQKDLLKEPNKPIKFKFYRNMSKTKKD